MRRLASVVLLLGLFCLRPAVSHALCSVSTSPQTFPNNSTMGAESCDTAGNQRTTAGTLASGEDQGATGANTTGVVVVEPRYLTLVPTLVDVQVKGSAGYVKNLVCTGSDAAATAGTIILYDSLTETGTIVYQWDVQAVAVTMPAVFPIERAFATGIYLGFTTTGDVRCMVSYR